MISSSGPSGGRRAFLTRILAFLAAAPALLFAARRANAQPPRVVAEPGLAPADTSTAVPPLVLDAHQDCLRRVLDRGDDLGEHIPDTHGDIHAWRAGGCNIVWFAAWIDPRKYDGPPAVRRTWDLFGALEDQARRHPRDLRIVTTAAEVRQAAADGFIASIKGIEGGSAIDSSLDELRKFREAGVRRMTIVWNGNLPWVGSAQSDDPSMGLTAFGREVVREMCRIGMLVDLSHASEQTCHDSLDVATLPVIFSHSNARALADHPRNVRDDVLKRLAENGGVIGVNFHTAFLRARGAHTPVTLNTILDQIEYIVNLIGIDHVGIGSDWDGGIRPPPPLENASGLPHLFEGLRRRGFNDDALRKFGAENFLRVLEVHDRV